MITPIPNLNMKNHVAAELTRLHQEIERLRAALSGIAHMAYRCAQGENVGDFPAEIIASVGVALANQQITEKPIRVQCKCGWMGNQNDLVSIPGGKSCPECDAIFHAFPKHEKA